MSCPKCVQPKGVPCNGCACGCHLVRTCGSYPPEGVIAFRCIYEPNHPGPCSHDGIVGPRSLSPEKTR